MREGVSTAAVAGDVRAASRSEDGLARMRATQVVSSPPALPLTGCHFLLADAVCEDLNLTNNNAHLFELLCAHAKDEHVDRLEAGLGCTQGLESWTSRGTLSFPYCVPTSCKRPSCRMESLLVPSASMVRAVLLIAQAHPPNHGRWAESAT